MTNQLKSIRISKPKSLKRVIFLQNIVTPFVALCSKDCDLPITLFTIRALQKPCHGIPMA